MRWELEESKSGAPHRLRLVVAKGLSYPVLIDPSWVPTGRLGTARSRHSATLLPNGKVLVAGGNHGHAPSSSAELYDPATGTWTATGSMGTARDRHTATLLRSGKVLVAGGQGELNGFLNSAELYDPATGTWTATGNFDTPRAYHTATLLANGKVLVAGGSNNGFQVFSSTQLYDPATGTGRRPAAWAPHVPFTRRRCCPMARCWWRGVQRGLSSLQ